MGPATRTKPNKAQKNQIANLILLPQFAISGWTGGGGGGSRRRRQRRQLRLPSSVRQLLRPRPHGGSDLHKNETRKQSTKLFGDGNLLAAAENTAAVVASCSRQTRGFSSGSGDFTKGRRSVVDLDLVATNAAGSPWDGFSWSNPRRIRDVGLSASLFRPKLWSVGSGRRRRRRGGGSAEP